MVIVTLKTKDGKVVFEDSFETIDKANKWIADWQSGKSYDSTLDIFLVDNTATDLAKELADKQKLADAIVLKDTVRAEIKSLIAKKPKTVDELTIIIEKILILLGVS